MTATAPVKSSASDKGRNASQSSKGKKLWSGVPKKERSRAMSELATKRWEGVAQSEDELRNHFETVDLDGALATFAIMRKQYEMAGRIIDDRIQKERNVEACANCNKPFTKDVPWFNRDPVKDPETGIITNIFTCSQACLIAVKGRQRHMHRKF